VGTLYDFEDLCVLQNRKLPIRKGQTLKWIGISEEGVCILYSVPFRGASCAEVWLLFRLPLSTILKVSCI
jgi:hypothetical protein